MNDIYKMIYDVTLGYKVKTNDAYFLDVGNLPVDIVRKILIELIKDDGQGITCLSENIDIEEIEKSLFALLTYPDDRSMHNFCVTVMEKIFLYYAPAIQIMIDDALTEQAA
jgi:hypothetical protein